jgi:hypothetical protein
MILFPLIHEECGKLMIQRCCLRAFTLLRGITKLPLDAFYSLDVAFHLSLDTFCDQLPLTILLIR